MSEKTEQEDIAEIVKILRAPEGYSPSDILRARVDGSNYIENLNRNNLKLCAERSLPAWNEKGYAAACADMAGQIKAARNGGGGELLAANVCISSLCIAYKNAAMQDSLAGAEGQPS